MNVPTDLHYTREHEWVRLIDDTTAEVGITDYAQNSLGDITFVELPPVGTGLQTGATFGVVESVKAASDLFAPIDGEITEINDALSTAPEQVNQDPYAQGWMLRLKITDRAQIDGLMSAVDYEKFSAG